jgi:subtilisin family serine protease
MSVQSDLKAFGVAKVLVTLKSVPPGNSLALAAAAPNLKEVTDCFHRSPDSREGATALAAGKKKPPTPYRIYRNLGLILGSVDDTGYANLRKSASVKAVNQAPILSLIKPVAADASSATKGVTWGIKRMRVDKLWSQGITGSGVLVGHLDTGVDGKHPAFKGGAIARFAEFDFEGDQVVGATPRDSGEHGTHTAATIAGRPVKGSKFGVAPDAQLASALVIEGGDVVARILAGMDWIVGEGVRILSMSLGLRGFHEDFLPLMQAIRNRGILPVIAVGNEFAGTSRSPGNYEIVLSVGAFGEDEKVADFSSSQRFVRPVDPLVPDIVGPGVEVLSALPGGQFGTMDGSSMATPHIAGLAALLWQAQPGATADQIESAILRSCKRPASMPEARANRGAPDAVDALGFLQGAAGAAVTAKGRRTRKTTKAGKATTATKKRASKVAKKR